MAGIETNNSFGINANNDNSMQTAPQTPTDFQAGSQDITPMTLGRFAQNAVLNKGDYFSQDGKLFHQREGKVFQVTGHPDGDYELNAGETAAVNAQRDQDQTFKARNVASGGGGLMSNETSSDSPAAVAKPQPEVRKLNDYERQKMKEVGFTDEQLDPITLHIGERHKSIPMPMDAITDNNDIYFKECVHDSASIDGLSLLAHEIQHAHQYRNGMTMCGYIGNSFRGYGNNKYEKDAQNCENDAEVILKENRKREFYREHGIQGSPLVPN